MKIETKQPAKPTVVLELEPDEVEALVVVLARVVIGDDTECAHIYDIYEALCDAGYPHWESKYYSQVSGEITFDKQAVSLRVGYGPDVDFDAIFKDLRLG